MAHPRSRGDHIPVAQVKKMQAGSSPLARGPPVNKPEPSLWGGLIPARAGTTTELYGCARGCWAHPRSRGDHKVHWVRDQLDRGSSPLARGPLTFIVYHMFLVGLIPARAGTTSNMSA